MADEKPHLKVFTVVFNDGSDEINVPGVEVDLDRDKGIATIKTKGYGGDVLAKFRNVQGVYMKEHHVEDFYNRQEGSNG